MKKKLQNNREACKNVFSFIFIMFLFMPFSYAGNSSNPTTVEILVQQIKTKVVTVRMTNIDIKDILYELQKQSAVSFIYDSKELSSIGRLSLDVNKVTVEAALNTLLYNTGFGFKVVDNGISIFKEPVVQQTEKKVLKGKVLDKASKAPVIGATVIAVKTSNGAVTDSKGEFVINNVKVGDEIDVSFMGMKGQIVTVPQSFNVIISLEADAVAIEDVVVNGVFERKANTFTGSVTTIKQEQLKRVGNSNVMQALKNIDPSIMFYDNMEFGSDPNAMPSMSMRGKSSIAMEDTDLRATYQNDPNAPLFVLDGFEVSIQKVMDLDMNRVETMTILKDASAKAIYGSKAANGVIIIELKKNASGRLRLTYNGSVELQAPDLTSYNLTNSAEKLDVEKANGMFEDENNAGLEDIMAKKQLYNQRLSFVLSGVNTDWMSKPLEIGVGTKHGISVELGDGDLKSIIDLSYNNVSGVMKGSDRTNISGGLSLNYRHKNFTFRNQFTITSNVANDSKYGDFDTYSKLNPYYTPYDANGMITQNIIPQLANISGGNENGGGSVFVGEWYKKVGFEANPLYNAQLNTVLQNRYLDFINNFDFQWQATNSVKLTARMGLSEKRSKGDTFYPSSHLKFSQYTGDMEARKGSYDMLQGAQSNLDGKLDIQYNKEIVKDNFIYVNAGYDISQKRMTENKTTAEGFPSDMMNDIMFARQYLKDGKPTGKEQTIREMGYYLSMNYSYNNRINVDGTLRQSASSMYSADKRWGMFWSVGTSWNIHNERWMNKDLFSQLRVRASIGSTGSQSGNAYNAIASYGFFLDRTYEGLLGAQLLGMHNPSLMWQEKFDKNIGIDVNIKNRLSLTFEYYNSITNNALNPITLAPSSGFDTVQENVGKIENKGFDFRANYTAWQRPSDRSYLSFSIAISRNTNTLKEVSEAMRSYNERQNNTINSTNKLDEYGNPIVRNKPVNKYYDGLSMDAIWAIRSLGIDPATGNEIYMVKDADGDYYRSYLYDANSQVICGDALPKFQGNFGVNFEYKGFGLNCVFRYQYGAQMYNRTLVDRLENANITYNVDRRIFTDRWRKPGDNTPYKKIEDISVADKNAIVSTETKATSRFVQDRNELTISSIQLSYDFFNFGFLKKIGMERMKVAINANDLYTLSSIKIERGTSYPFARTFNGSLSFTF